MLNHTKSSEAFLSFLAWCWDPVLWLQAHWEPPTTTKMSLCRTTIRRTKAKWSNLLASVQMYPDKSAWDSSVLINSVNGDRTLAGEYLSQLIVLKASQWFSRKGGLGSKKMGIYHLRGWYSLGEYSAKGISQCVHWPFFIISKCIQGGSLSETLNNSSAVSVRGALKG